MSLRDQAAAAFPGLASKGRPEESEWKDSRESIYLLALLAAIWVPSQASHNKVPQALPGVIYECRAKSHEH